MSLSKFVIFYITDSYLVVLTELMGEAEMTVIIITVSASEEHLYMKGSFGGKQTFSLCGPRPNISHDEKYEI